MSGGGEWTGLSGGGERVVLGTVASYTCIASEISGCVDAVAVLVMGGVEGGIGGGDGDWFVRVWKGTGEVEGERSSVCVGWMLSGD